MTASFKSGGRVPVLSLAPMAGVGDRAFRLSCIRHGAEYVTTEMVSAKAICYGDKKTPVLASLTENELPAAIQLFGSEPEFMAGAISALLGIAAGSGIFPAAFDINMGCPMAKITDNGEGSALLKNLPLAGRIIEAAVKAAGDIPVTVKLRAGWDPAHINIRESALTAQESGASAICVHARTRSQMYAPGAELAYIRTAKETVRIPVIGNGDIFTGTDAVRMLSETGCDGIAAARGALGNPWLFSEIKAALNGSVFTPPSITERTEEALLQLRTAISEKGERTAVLECRKHMGYYLKGFPGCSKLRARVNGALSYDEIAELLSKAVTAGYGSDAENEDEVFTDGLF